MVNVFELRLDDGSTVLVEATDQDEARLDRVGRTREALQNTADTLEQALQRVKPALDSVVRQARGLAEPPDKVTIEFGIKVTAEAGVVIAKAATEANFTLNFEWTREAG